MLNTIVLIGRLATDPELRYTPSGVAVTTFRLAVQRPGKDAETDFIDIVAWRQLAEFAANYLTKGRLVAVDGRLQIRSWVAQDGTRRRSAEVITNELRGLDWPREQSKAEPTAQDLNQGGRPALGQTYSDEEEVEHSFADPFAAI
jgi:single-strand DNA-binding protein